MPVSTSLKARLKLGFAALYLLASSPASADKLQDGAAAYTHGNFDKALSLLKPLAAHGDSYAEMTLGLIYAKARASSRIMPKRRIGIARPPKRATRSPRPISACSTRKAAA